MVSAIILLFFTSENKVNHQFDGRITLRAKDKIPYGTYVAFESLKQLFPGAAVVSQQTGTGLLGFTFQL